MMRRSRLMQGGAVALAMLVGGCAQAGAAGGPPVGDGSGATSTPQHDVGDLGDAIVTLDPDNLPDADSTEVHLLVTETACAGGEPADGRVALERLVEHEDRVELAVGVEALDGAQTCQSNPPTPFTVELDEPLGARALVDVGVDPERELAVP